MKRYLTLLVALSFPYLVNALNYDSGQFGIGSTSNITIATMTAQSITVSTLTVSVTTSISSETVTNAIFSTSLRLPKNAAPRTNVTPLSVGELIMNTTAFELCTSTGTVPTSWVRISTPSLACSN